MLFISPYRLQPLVHRPAFGGELLAACLSSYFKTSHAGYGAVVGDSKKIEGIRLPSVTGGILPLEIAETDVPAFLRMYFQPVFPEPLL